MFKKIYIVFLAISLRWHLRNPGRILVAGIALGVGALLGNIIIDLNARTASSFQSAMSASMQTYGAEIRFASPLDPLILDEFWDYSELDRFHFFPFVETTFLREGRRYPLVVSFCFMENCGEKILIPQTWISFFRDGETITLFGKSFPLESSDSDSLSTARLDISGYPEKKIDGFFLREDPTNREIAALSSVFQKHSVRFKLIPVSEQKSDSDTITVAFRNNLFALALIALLVAGYLVFASLDISFENRSRLFSSLISLGLRPILLRVCIYIESISLGLVAGSFAWVVGHWVATRGWEVFSLLLPDVFGVIPSQYDSFLPGSLILPLSVGTSLLSGHLAFSKQTTMSSRKRESLSIVETDWLKRGILLLALGLGTLFTILLFYYKNPIFGYIAVAFLFFSINRLASPAIGLIARLYPKSLITWKLASRALTGYGQKFIAPVSALTVAISLCISMTVLISSFKHTLNQWLKSNVRADSYFSFHETVVPEDIQEMIQDTELNFPRHHILLKLGKTKVERTNQNPSKRRVADIMVQDFSKIKKLNPPDLTEGRIQNVLASETAAMNWDLKIGDKIRFVEWDLEGEIGGVYKNYTSRRGSFLIDLGDKKYSALTESLGYTGIALYLPESMPQKEFEEFLLNYSNLGVNQPSRALRESALELFDQTFAITYLLQIISFLLASSAIAFSLISLIHSRRRELAILAGMANKSRYQVIYILILEALGILFASLLLSLPASYWLSWVLIEGINRFSFGWTLSWAIPYTAIGGIVLGSFASGLVTSFWVGRKLPILEIWSYLRSKE